MEILTVQEISALLDIGRTTANAWCNQGKFPNAKQKAGVWMIPPSDVITYLQSEMESHKEQAEKYSKLLDKIKTL